MTWQRRKRRKQRRRPRPRRPRRPRRRNPKKSKKRKKPAKSKKARKPAKKAAKAAAEAAPAPRSTPAARKAEATAQRRSRSEGGSQAAPRIQDQEGQRQASASQKARQEKLREGHAARRALGRVSRKCKAIAGLGRRPRSVARRRACAKPRPRLRSPRQSEIPDMQAPRSLDKRIAARAHFFFVSAIRACRALTSWRSGLKSKAQPFVQ